MNLNLTTLGRRLCAARVNCGLSQLQAAELIGLQRTAIVHIEAGRRSVSTLELAAFAEHYQANIVEFFAPGSGGEDPVAVMLGALSELRDHAKSVASIRHSLLLFSEGKELERALGREARTFPPDYATLVETRAQAVEQGFAAARRERARLELGDLPVIGMCRLIANQGIWATSVELPHDEFSGFLLNHPAIGMAIGVNHEYPLARMRLAYAHEYGHALFDRGKGVAYTAKSNAGDLIERRANAFAAAFLVPERGVAAILESLHKGGPSRRSYATYDVASDEVRESERRAVPGTQQISFREAAVIAQQFGVSYEVACYRLSDLDFINKGELRVLLEQSDLGDGYRDLLGDDLIEVEQGENRLDDLVPQLIPLVLEAFGRGLISRGKLRELAKSLGLRERAVLRFA